MTERTHRWKVVSTSPTFGKSDRQPVQVLETAGCEVQLLNAADVTTVNRALSAADAWIVGFDKVNEQRLSPYPNLSVVAKCGAGLDNFDIPYLETRGIRIISVPGGNASAVAEYTIAQILSLTRGLIKNNQSVRSGRWKPMIGQGINGRTLGVIGYGAIGNQVAALARSIGMLVLVFDPYFEPGAATNENNVTLVSLKELLSQSDVVTLHVPLTDRTELLIGSAELSLMRPDSYLINNSRGGVVDETALAQALSNGKIAGAALDVFIEEPLSVDNPILKVPNLIASPHSAGYSDRALSEVTLRCAKSILNALRTTTVKAEQCT